MRELTHAVHITPVNYTDIVFSPHGSLLFEFEIATTINFDT